MTKPIVTWCEKNTEGEIVPIPETGYKWSIGEVKAGEKSKEKTFWIWNNKGGETDVSPMQDCKITVVDNASEHKDIITEKWIQCKLDTVDGDQFTKIGGTGFDDGKEIMAKGQEAGTIKGIKNDGSVETDTDNYAQVTLFALPNVETTESGIRKFKVRVSYCYV